MTNKNKKIIITVFTLLEISLLAGCAQKKLAENISLEQTQNQGQDASAKQEESEQKDKKMSPEEEAVLKDYADYLFAEYMYIQPGNSKGAEEFIKKEIERTKPYNLFKILTYAKLLNTRKQYELAYQFTSRVLNAQKLSDYQTYLAKDILPQAYLTHAVAAAGLFKANEALNFVNAAEKFHSTQNYSAITFYKAKVIALLGHEQQAADYLKSRIEINTDKKNMNTLYWPRALSYLGQLSLYLNDLEQAKAAYEALVAYGDKTDEKLNNELNKKGLPATKAFDEPEAHYNLGQIYAGLGNKQKAIEHYGAAIKSWPDSTVAHSKRGSLYLEAKQYTQAIEDFSVALKNQPYDTELLYKRAYSLCMNGSSVRGRADLKAILEVDSEYPQAKNLLKQCRG